MTTFYIDFYESFLSTIIIISICIVNILACCLVGYNDFNNLVMQTLWWLHNKILRYIHKKIFSIFLSRFLRICYQSLKKVLIWPKNFFFFLSKKVSKNAEFHADFESVEKNVKKCTKKSNKQNKFNEHE